MQQVGFLRSRVPVPEHSQAGSLPFRYKLTRIQGYTDSSSFGVSGEIEAYADSQFSYLYAMKRSGSADLPLHYGYVPKWLPERMAKLGLAVTAAIRKLHEIAVRAEKDFVPNTNFDALIEKERAESWKHGGRTVFGKSKPPKNDQLSLF